MEAALAALGSESEDVLEHIEEERESGLAPSIDITFLLSNVVPSLLNLSGVFLLTVYSISFTENGGRRVSVCARKGICVCQPVRQTAAT